MIPIPLMITMMATNNMIQHITTSSLNNVRHLTTSSSHNETQNKIKNIQNNEMLLLISKKGFKMTINQNETIKMYRLFRVDYGTNWEAVDSSNNVICSENTLSRCIEELVSKINPVEIECMPTLINDGHIREFSIMAKVPDMEAINYKKEIMVQAEKMAQNMPAKWGNGWD